MTDELLNRVFIGDTPEQLDCGIMINGEIWTGKRISELQSAYHQLKEAISKVEICGVPLHHLSHDLAKHFSVDTYTFSKDIEREAIFKLKLRLKNFAKENQPSESDCSAEMVNGWKSAMFEVTSMLNDELGD